MSPEPVYGDQAAQLLAGRPLCTACVLTGDRLGEVGLKPMTNALVLDPDDVVHAGDAITGTTACGRNANLWRWVVPTIPERKVDEVEQ